ncbi:MAG: hypothetical protein K2G89_03095 [Lachnospiraceae bacterium]|nr:hypothetical protein [Lachnospiraceae bacterium]
MGKKGVEDMISELEIFIDNCKYSPLSTNKILVPKDEIASMLNELRLKLPSEIDRSKKIMRNKEAILTDARNRADALLQEANEEANRLVAESQIVELANIQANEIVSQAQQQAASIVKAAQDEENELRLGAMLYTKTQLDNIKKYIDSTLEAEKTNYEHLIASLENDNFVVNTNAEEIDSQIRMMQGENPASEDTLPEAGRGTSAAEPAGSMTSAAQPIGQTGAVTSNTQPIGQIGGVASAAQPMGQAGGVASNTRPMGQPMTQAMSMQRVPHVSNPVADAASVVQQALAEHAMAAQVSALNTVGVMEEDIPKPRSMGTVVDGAAQDPLW